MKSRRLKLGFTLVEILIVVMIVAVLATLVVGITGRLDAQSKARLTRSTIAIVEAALREFRDYEYQYPNSAYAGFDFPLDCHQDPNNPADLLVETVAEAFAIPVTYVSIAGPAGFVHKEEYSGSEGLYFFLSRVPQCRKTLDEIDKSLITNEDDNGNPMEIIITVGAVSRNHPLLRIVDPWGRALRYDYYDERIPAANIGPRLRSKRSFPAITSAGPDKMFGTDDDISGRKQ